MTITTAELIVQKDKELEAQKDVYKSFEIAQAPSLTPRKDVWWTTESAMTMSSLILLFGLCLCGLIAMLMLRDKSIENALRAFGTILIIVAGLFLIVAGYSDQQIGPLMGLLGTIAGYLLGKETKPTVVVSDDKKIVRSNQNDH